MPTSPEETHATLRSLAREAAEHAYTRFSGRPRAAVLLLADGSWVPGVRVESASFSLVVPALLNAVTTVVATGGGDVVAAASSRALLDEEVTFIRSVLPGSWRRAGSELLVRGADAASALPAVRRRVEPFLDGPAPPRPEDGVELARTVAGRAYVPESRFPVGCVLETGDGRLVPGVNVEHTDWTRILCAERNALGTAVSYGLRSFRGLYLSCPKDPAGTPCGACRQLLAELAPEIPVWMDRGPGVPPTSSTPAELLPGCFTGQAL